MYKKISHKKVNKVSSPPLVQNNEMNEKGNALEYKPLRTVCLLKENIEDKGCLNISNGVSQLVRIGGKNCTNYRDHKLKVQEDSAAWARWNILVDQIGGEVAMKAAVESIKTDCSDAAEFMNKLEGLYTSDPGAAEDSEDMSDLYIPNNGSGTIAGTGSTAGGKHYWVTSPGSKSYAGSFGNHEMANKWWAANKSSYPGGTFGQGNSSKKFK